MRCRRAVISRLDDPDSFECASSTEPQIEGEYWTAVVYYRAKNGFGAKVLTNAPKTQGLRSPREGFARVVAEPADYVGWNLGTVTSSSVQCATEKRERLLGDRGSDIVDAPAARQRRDRVAVVEERDVRVH
jgi:hypothetical protein